MITAVQCKMARAAVGMDIEDLARAAGVAAIMVSSLERGEATSPEAPAAIRHALEKAGVIFLDDGALTPGGPGVRLATGHGAGSHADEGARPENLNASNDD